MLHLLMHVHCPSVITMLTEPKTILRNAVIPNRAWLQPATMVQLVTRHFSCNINAFGQS